jgi:hypothetical protein
MTFLNPEKGQYGPLLDSQDAVKGFDFVLMAFLISQKARPFHAHFALLGAISLPHKPH